MIAPTLHLAVHRPGREGAAPMAAGAPLRIHAVLDERTGQCAYVLACERTRAAALVDPAPTLWDALAEQVTRHQLRPRLVLRTAPVGGQTVSVARYAALMQDLGMALPSASAGADRRDPWADLPWAGPLARQGDHELLAVQAGAGTVRLRRDEGPGPMVTVGGSCGRPQEGAVVGGLRAAVGAFHVLAIPMGHQPRLAWLVADRLFTGLTLRGGTGPATADELLGLPPDTLVYPGRAHQGQLVSTVAQERLHSDRGAVATQPTRHRHLRVVSQP
ncbi:hypothetical protein L6R53_12755 [Myxococcota bacterium]|nr:hypothetical protein [Myxococcota bacterium]